MSGAIFTADVWLLYFLFFCSVFCFSKFWNFSTKEGQVNPLSFLELVYVWCVCMHVYVYV